MSRFYPSSVSLANMRSTLASIVQSSIINGHDSKPLSSAYAPFPMAAACIGTIRPSAFALPAWPGIEASRFLAAHDSPAQLVSG